MKFLLSILFIIPLYLYSQTVRITNTPPEADYFVYITTNPSEADCSIYVTQTLAESNFEKGVWYITDQRYLGEVVICLVEYKSMSNFKIILVNNKTQASCHLKTEHRN